MTSISTSVSSVITDSFSICLITGATAGLGRECALKLSSLPTSPFSHIILGCRNLVAARALAALSPRFIVLDAPLDLSELDSVRAYVSALSVWLAGRRINSLVLNAGIGGSLPAKFSSSPSSIEQIFGTNHLGHYALALLAAPLLYRAARVVVVASEVHDPAVGAPFPDPSAAWPLDAAAYDAAFPAGGVADSVAGNRRYARSKLLNVLFGQELAARAPLLFVASFNPGLMLDSSFVGRIAGPFAGAVAWALTPLLRLTLLGDIIRTAPLSGCALAALAVPSSKFAMRGHYYCATLGGEPVLKPASVFARSQRGALAARDIWRHSARWAALTDGETAAADAAWGEGPHPRMSLCDGLAIPVIGFGTWRCDVAKLRGAVAHAIGAGYRHIDSGPYKNEVLVGEGIVDAIAAGAIKGREELWITGKVPTNAMDPAAVEPSLRKMLADLGTDYVDVLITHWPYAIDPANTASPPSAEYRLGYSPEAYLATWRAMEACVDKGLARSLGCSNMSAKKLYLLMKLARHRPVVVQNEMHPALAQGKLVEFCRKEGVVCCGYSPLGSPGRPDLYRASGE